MRVRGLGMAGLGLAVASLLVAANARADIDLIFNYSTGSVAPTPIGTQGDTIGLVGVTSSVEVTGYGADNAAGGMLNTVNWTRVKGATGLGTLDLTRNITVTLVGGGGPQSTPISQNAVLSYTVVNTVPGQQMDVQAGSDVSLRFGSYLLTITPQDSTWYATGSGKHANLLNADFMVTAVPESTTTVAGAGALGLVVLSVFRSKRSGVIKIGA